MLSVEQIVKENQGELEKLPGKVFAAAVIAALHVTIEMLKEELDATIRDYEGMAA